MKICFLYESAFTLGGVQRCITMLSNYLVHKGYEVTIICTNTRVPINREIYGLDKEVQVLFTKKQNIIRKCINRGLKLIKQLNYKTGCLKNNTKILDFIYYYYFGRYVQEIIDEKNYDILIGCGEYHSKLASMMKKKEMKKIGWQHHTYDMYFNADHNFWNEEACSNEMFKNLDGYVVLTLDDKKKLKKLKNVNCETIYNPIGFKQEFKSKLESKKFLALGRLDKVKGFDRLINNFSQFHKKNKEWILEIYGDGPEREKLEKQVKLLGLENVVNIYHRAQNVKEIYREASVYCMSSYTEGWGLVILEAMESGLPVISYEMPCIKEIFKTRYEGIVIPMDDDEKYVSEMLTLANDKSLREKVANNAYKRAKDFDMEKIGEQWENLFKNLKN